MSKCSYFLSPGSLSYWAPDSPWQDHQITAETGRQNEQILPSKLWQTRSIQSQTGKQSLVSKYYWNQTNESWFHIESLCLFAYKA